MFNLVKAIWASNWKTAAKVTIVPLLAVAMLPFAVTVARAQTAVDPGLRGGAPGAGEWYSNLPTSVTILFQRLISNFSEQNEVVQGSGGDEPRVGLGPRFDSNSCNSCHAQPAVGGSSPPNNLLFSVYQLNGATNIMPFFETPNGPTLVARFPFKSTDLSVPDGHVQQLFTITGRVDAGSCNIAQPDFATAAAENNLIFRNTTPTFGGGLLDFIRDSDIVNNGTTVCNTNSLGICGHPNLQPDGSVGRFGWKAQVRSLTIFSGEAYNVEEGVTNELFPNEIDETPGCVLNPLPEDGTDWNLSDPVIRFTGDPERFGQFSRLLAPPTPGDCPGGNPASCTNGQTQFNNVGCVLCHTTSFTTPTSNLAALSQVTANLFSDVLVHHMGPCQADNVVQGSAQGDEFRTAPLWGVGQRVFFMRDGGTTDIVQAIEDHFCIGNSQYPDSEANAVINNFNALSATDQQDLVNFLRSL